MKKDRIRAFTMAVGLLLAVAMVLSSVPVISKKMHVVSTAKSEKEQKEKEVVSFNVCPASTLPSTFHVNLNLETYCLFVITSIHSVVGDFMPPADFSPRKLFFKLFRVIISPNAP